MPLPLPVTCRRAECWKTKHISSQRWLLQEAMGPVILDGSHLKPIKEEIVAFLPAPAPGAAPKSGGN